MDVIYALVLYTLIFMFVIFSIVIFRKLNTKVTEKITGFLVDAYVTLTPTIFRTFCNALVEKCVYQRNHLFQILYLILLASGYIMYYLTTYSFVSETVFGKIPFALLIVNLIIFTACSYTDPGIITKKNHRVYYSMYTYDGVMFKENNECVTCCFLKPARSKHCSLCDVCVARFDHHCSWVNNCIGVHNNKYFLLFLFSLLVMTLLPSFLTVMVFISLVQRKQLHLSQFVDAQGRIYEADFSTIASYFVGEYPMMSLLLMYLGLLFIALFLFFCFHCLLIVTNRTTNEIFKYQGSYDDGDKPVNDNKGDTRLNVKKRSKIPDTSSNDVRNSRPIKRKTRRDKVHKHFGEQKIKTKNDGDQSNPSHKKNLDVSNDKKSYIRRFQIFGHYSQGLFGNIFEVING